MARQGPQHHRRQPRLDPSGPVELPPRPREVRLNGVDPCSLLTEQQRAELGLDARPVFSQAPVGLTEYCSVVVEVAAGQLLDVQFRDGGRRPPIQCRRDVETIAGEAVNSLLDSFVRGSPW
jgi:hypothetical protein